MLGREFVPPPAWLGLTSMKDVLHHGICFIYFVYVATTFLFSNYKVISEIQKIHGKKLQNFQTSKQSFCFLIIIMTIMLRPTMLIWSFLIFQVTFWPIIKRLISKMKLIYANTSKFKKIQIDGSEVLNHLIHM